MDDIPIRERLLVDIQEGARELTRRADLATKEIRRVEAKLKDANACVQLDEGVDFEWEEGGKPRKGTLTYRKANGSRNSLGFRFHVLFHGTSESAVNGSEPTPLTSTKREVRVAAMQHLDTVLRRILGALKTKDVRL